MPPLALRSVRRSVRRSSLDTRLSFAVVTLAVAVLGWVLTRPVPAPRGFAAADAAPRTIAACTPDTRAPATCRTANAVLVLGRPRTPVRVGDAIAEVLRVRRDGSRATLEVRLTNHSGASRALRPSQLWLSVAGRRIDAAPSAFPEQLGSQKTTTRRVDVPLTRRDRRAIAGGAHVEVGIAPFTRRGRRTVGVVAVRVTTAPR